MFGHAKSPSKNNLNIVHLAYERHAALANACVVHYAARLTPGLASRLAVLAHPCAHRAGVSRPAQAANCSSYFCLAPNC